MFALAAIPHERLERGGGESDEHTRRGVPGVLDGVWHAPVEVARVAGFELDDVVPAHEADAALDAQDDLFAVVELAFDTAR